MKRPYRAAGFTLIEMMVAILIFGILISIAFPVIIRARAQSQAKACSRNLRTIEGLKETFALDARKAQGTTVTLTDIAPYMKPGTSLACPISGTINYGTLGQVPTCSGAVAYPHTITGQ